MSNTARPVLQDMRARSGSVLTDWVGVHRTPLHSEASRLTHKPGEESHQRGSCSSSVGPHPTLHGGIHMTAAQADMRSVTAHQRRDTGGPNGQSNMVSQHSCAEVQCTQKMPWCPSQHSMHRLMQDTVPLKWN
jgi:hypothetical protein